MSFNCLTLKRTVSINERDHFGHKQKPSVTFCCASRAWSGNYEQMSSESMSKKTKKGHGGRNTIDTTYESKGFNANSEPRLVRSCGLRRDWSFEDLRKEMTTVRN
ncbi:Detected protein of unknown function [Hibiscus syriacus]|uniref:Uncharacterized protein n=1 Tax=Hibiscus syriacus TaxID=106335 RepID=A0A6A2YEX9_HIBSY|nr:Detected protein of unknown function [Hibiscus syriacus]